MQTLKAAVDQDDIGELVFTVPGGSVFGLSLIHISVNALESDFSSSASKSLIQILPSHKLAALSMAIV